MDDFRKLIDGYDTGIKYMDEHIGRILNRLADLNVLDETADHCECRPRREPRRTWNIQ